ncbi:MAG: adenylyltransferase/cytidyltransferase family protein [Candidatus Sungbacteria bacterium]|nr:adenylyltransferase/cytidyltransferase family protein [bacterium]MDZ4260633.1 adenylyltransferase/cytidyltransferase family protein [Candidatus Sungbacteria bacterium]
METCKVKKVMVFGVFDRLHAGHLSFLEQAVQYGDELIVVVARDSSVKELKNKIPYHTQEERIEAVRQSGHAYHVVLGDEKIGSYGVIKKYKPDMICLGYDQKELVKDIESCMARGELPLVEFAMMMPYNAERFHTSLLTE